MREGVTTGGKMEGSYQAMASAVPERNGTKTGFKAAAAQAKTHQRRISASSVSPRPRQLYFDTAANRSECSNDWNCLSSLLKCICRSELSEFTVTLSSAIFSVAVAVIFL